MAFTYNEPTVWFEFVYDTARLLRRHGYISALISNGFIEPGALEEILPYIDAFNLDLKGFSNAFYRKHCRGELEPVLKVMAMVAGRCHLEVTCLIIPSLNDSPRELNEMFAWLASLSPDLPVHITRYFPSHQLTIPPTPLETLVRVRETALKKMNYVYLGNIGDSEFAHTYCPRCSSLLIERTGRGTRVLGLDGSNCRYCGQAIPVIL
ncbi:MAG: Radical SAM superfamily protein [Firmicutes bacterium ADurb.Bin456]|nr:MAG: Radical SAM superfamily protein [Firmicutes bacterium ADurb.Bin456]